MPIFIPISKTTKRPTSAAKGFSQPGYQGVEFGPHVALRLEGYAVVDADTMPAAKAWRDAEGTDTPFVVVTARGMHFYYRAVGGYKSNTTSFGDLDLKTGIGSYVMAPGALFAESANGKVRANESFGSYTPVGELQELPSPEDLPPLPVLALERFRTETPRMEYDGTDGWEEVPSGAGHGTMLSLAGSLRNLGMSSTLIRQVLDATNEIIMPTEPMSSDRVEHYVSSAKSWEPGDTPTTPEPEETDHRLHLDSFESITMERATWVWDDRIPTGAITMLAGRPGVGKSTTALDVAAAITVGTLPGEDFGTPHHILIAATEDSFAHIIVPRFKAAGGNMTMAHRIRTVTDEELSLPGDLDELREIIGRLDAKLLIIDPLISRLGKSDTNKDDDVRKSLEPLARLADETGVAVVGIMHFNKTGTTDPLVALMGSTAFGAVARSYLVAVRDPDDETQFVFMQAKNSFGATADTITYRLTGVEVGQTDKGPITSSKVDWGDDDPRSVYDVMQRVQSAKQEKRETKFDIAVAWLRQRLNNAPSLKADVVADASDNGITESTLVRARQSLSVITDIPEPGGPAWWRLPNTPDEIAQPGNKDGK